MSRSSVTLLLCALGIYASFLIWALVQEPLTYYPWPETGEKFKAPNVIAVAQSAIAIVVGYAYLHLKKHEYTPLQLLWDYKKEMALISLTQSSSAPLAQYSLQYVDYLTYMLAKSCKIIPVLVVHMVLYRTPIPHQKKLVAILVTTGVIIFTVGGHKGNDSSSFENSNTQSTLGHILLVSSLLMDGLTNATQDKMMKSNKSYLAKHKKSQRIITGSHMMFSLNLFILLWNALYMIVYDRDQLNKAIFMLKSESQLPLYLAIYALCGAIGQCFIFYTLEHFGSLALVMITVTRKMMSMLLSIVVFGKTVGIVQWFGIVTVFSGIFWEAMTKRRQIKEKKEEELKRKIQ